MKYLGQLINIIATLRGEIESTLHIGRNLNCINIYDLSTLSCIHYLNLGEVSS